MLEVDLKMLLGRAKRHRRLSPGEYLFRQSDKVRSVHILSTGGVKLTRVQPDGREFILHRATGLTLLAEASVYAARYHCDAIATGPSEIHSLPADRFLKLLQDDPPLAARWSAYLSSELQSARMRIELLTKQKVEDRLSAWLDWHGGKIPPKGTWRDLAAELNVAPESLYRELARRRLAATEKK